MKMTPERIKELREKYHPLRLVGEDETNEFIIFTSSHIYECLDVIEELNRKIDILSFTITNKDDLIASLRGKILESKDTMHLNEHGDLMRRLSVLEMMYNASLKENARLRDAIKKLDGRWVLLDEGEYIELNLTEYYDTDNEEWSKNYKHDLFGCFFSSKNFTPIRKKLDFKDLLSEGELAEKVRSVATTLGTESICESVPDESGREQLFSTGNTKFVLRKKNNKDCFIFSSYTSAVEFLILYFNDTKEDWDITEETSEICYDGKEDENHLQPSSSTVEQTLYKGQVDGSTPSSAKNCPPSEGSDCRTSHQETCGCVADTNEEATADSSAVGECNSEYIPKTTTVATGACDKPIVPKLPEKLGYYFPSDISLKIDEIIDYLTAKEQGK
jgi:hypothetical protein